MDDSEGAPSKATLEKEREERIRARRIRIQQKIEAQKAGGEVDAMAEREQRKQVRISKIIECPHFVHDLPPRPACSLRRTVSSVARELTKKMLTT
jgi:hypothetical protein